jgi:hypothetical protein
MNTARSTRPSPEADTPHLQARVPRTVTEKAWPGRRAWGAAALMVTGATGLSACISVNAPDKPIVIELNINIKQEVVYRLAADVKENIEANPEIF